MIDRNKLDRVLDADDVPDLVAEATMTA